MKKKKEKNKEDNDSNGALSDELRVRANFANRGQYVFIIRLFAGVERECYQNRIANPEFETLNLPKSNT